MTSIIFWILVILISIILLLINIAIAGYLHQSYFYKVSRADFVKELKNIIDGKMDYKDYDSFVMPTIVQDKLLSDFQYEIIGME